MPKTTHRANLFINPDIWRALRVRAAELDTTATDLLNRLIAEYLERTGSPGARTDTTQHGLSRQRERKRRREER